MMYWKIQNFAHVWHSYSDFQSILKYKRSLHFYRKYSVFLTSRAHRIHRVFNVMEMNEWMWVTNVVMRTYLIQLVTVDLSCPGWHNRMVMVSVHVWLWCDLCLTLIQSNSPTNHSLTDDGSGQLSDPNVYRASHQEYCSPTKIHLGQHTANWVFHFVWFMFGFVWFQLKCINYDLLSSKTEISQLPNGIHIYQSMLSVWMHFTC